MRTSLLVSVALLLVALAHPVLARAAECPYADADAATATTAQLAEATACLLNEQRARAGLAPLAASADLASVGQSYAQYLIATHSFSHVDDRGRTVVARVHDTLGDGGRRWAVLGENLGWGTGLEATPRVMMHAWMASPDHRANILYAPYDEVGIGIASGAPVPGVPDALTYVSEFGRVDTTRTRRHRARHRRCSRAKRRATHHSGRGCHRPLRRR